MKGKTLFIKRVLCMAGIVFIFLLGTHSVARAITFSIDTASPSGVSGADLLVPGPAGGPPTVAFTVASIGLLPGDEIDALSFGGAISGNPLFSVDRASVGAGGTAVATEAAAGQAAGDTYETTAPFTNILDFNQKDLGLLPAIAPGVPTAAVLDNLDAWDEDFLVDLAGPGGSGGPDGKPDGPIFFSLSLGSPSLAPFSAADILLSLDGVLVGPAFGFAALGLAFVDDIDALAFDSFGTPFYSLAPGSFSLGIAGDSAADVFSGIFAPGAPAFSAASLGLLAGDNLDALDFLDQDIHVVPEPSTIALLGIGLAGLGVGYLRRRRKQKQEIRRG